VTGGASRLVVGAGHVRGIEEREGVGHSTPATIIEKGESCTE
jgi:hypothetical protein